MDDFDLYKISAAKLTGKSCDADCLLCVSGTGCIRKKCNVLRHIVQDVGKSAFICTAQSKRYDLCSCFFDTCFYKIQGKFSGTKNKTGSKLMASQDQFVFICVCCCHFLCPPFFLSSIYLLSQQLPPPINCRISTTSPSFSTVVS